MSNTALRPYVASFYGNCKQTGRLRRCSIRITANAPGPVYAAFLAASAKLTGARLISVDHRPEHSPFLTR